VQPAQADDELRPAAEVDSRQVDTTSRRSIAMSKGMDRKKEQKKKAAKTPEEKRAAKKEKLAKR
jgi:hypothetical protein